MSESTTTYTVSDGGSLTVSILANDGYMISEDCVSISGAYESYTYEDGTISVTNIQSDIEIKVEAEEITVVGVECNSVTLTYSDDTLDSGGSETLSPTLSYSFTLTYSDGTTTSVTSGATVSYSLSDTAYMSINSSSGVVSRSSEYYGDSTASSIVTVSVSLTSNDITAKGTAECTVYREGDTNSVTVILKPTVDGANIYYKIGGDSIYTLVSNVSSEDGVSITVDVGTTIYYYSSKTGYTSTYTLSSPGSSTITGPQTIELTLKANTYTVTFNLTNLEACTYDDYRDQEGEDNITDSGLSVEYGSTIDDIIYLVRTDTSTYSLPDSIYIKMGTSSLTLDTDYTYDSTTGAISISTSITGNVVITAAAYIKCGISLTYSTKTNITLSDNVDFYIYTYIVYNDVILSLANTSADSSSGCYLHVSASNAYYGGSETITIPSSCEEFGLYIENNGAASTFNFSCSYTYNTTSGTETITFDTSSSDDYVYVSLAQFSSAIELTSLSIELTFTSYS